FGFSGSNPQPTQNLLVTVYSGGGNSISTPGFTLSDNSTGAHVSNTGVAGSNPVPNGGAANLIFAYLAPDNGAHASAGLPPGSILWDLTTTPTTTVIFRSNDDGSGDDDHDDSIAIATLVLPTQTPIPGTL